MKPLAFSVLRLLNDGVFHSGVSIASSLGVSRTSVCNSLHNVQKYGILVQKIPGRGYRWVNPFEWINKNKILCALKNARCHFDLTILDCIDSTNNYLLENKINYDLAEKNDYIPVIIAELQTNGRGRLGRQWQSALGDSLTFSFRWHFSQNASTLSGLSLAIGLAIIRVFKALSIQSLSLKWPNDILYQDRKIGGILIELRGEMHGSTSAVIGIGINFKMPNCIKAYITEKVADLFEITGHQMDRNKVLSSLLIELQDILFDFENYGFSYFKDEWNSCHAYHNKSVILKQFNTILTDGLVEGVSDDGSLIIKTPNGPKIFNIGELTLRGK